MAMNRPRLSFVASLALFLLGARPAVAQRIQVEREPIAVEYKRFDPANPPAEMPKLTPGDGAITEYSFGCLREIETTVVGQRRLPPGATTSAPGAPRTAASSRGSAQRGDGGCVAVVRVSGVRLTLRLTATVWLPVRARRKLVDHEEGHRTIVERIYDEFAEDAARQAALRWVGQTSTGEAPTCPVAQRAAIGKVTEAVGEEYLKATGDWARRVGDRYDAITNHGRRPIDEAEAIEQAFRAEPQNPRMKDEG